MCRFSKSHHLFRCFELHDPFPQTVNPGIEAGSEVDFLDEGFGCDPIAVLCKRQHNFCLVIYFDHVGISSFSNLQSFCERGYVFI